jgi:type IV pilus assembly protein PilQ
MIFKGYGSAVVWLAAGMLITSVAGCGGKEAAKKDPVIEKWEKLAEKSQGTSVTKRKAQVVIMESSLAKEAAAEKGVVKAEKVLPTAKLNLRMHGADIKAVLRSLARSMNMNIIVKENVKESINVDFVNTPWDQAFNSIVRAYGLTYVWDDDVIRIMTIGDMEGEMKMAEVRSKRATSEHEVLLVEPLVTIIAAVNYSDPKMIKDNLQELLTKDKDGKTTRGSVRVDEHSNSIIVQAIKGDIDRIIPILEKLDKPIPQILIKANIVEATKDAARDLGVQWGGMMRKKAAGSDHVWLTPGAGAAATGTTGGTGSTGATGPVDPISGGYTPVMGAAGLSGQGFASNFPPATSVLSGGGVGSLGLMFGTLGGNILDAQLQAMQKDGKLHIISSPSITTLDNQKAFTESGEKVPYVSTSTSGGGSTQDVKFIDAVLRLEITPHVIEGNTLKMKIVVKKEEADLTRTVQGNPFIVKKQTETTLIMGDGETIVISGLTKQKMSDQTSGVPGLKDIPLLGWLFKGQGSSDTFEEVMIFITPRILPPQEEVAAAVQGDKTAAGQDGEAAAGQVGEAAAGQVGKTAPVVVDKASSGVDGNTAAGQTNGQTGQASGQETKAK